MYASESLSVGTGPSVYVRVGRLETHPDGGWQIRVPHDSGDDQLYVGADGGGLTKDEAEQCLDAIDAFVAARN